MRDIDRYNGKEKPGDRGRGTGGRGRK